MKWPCQFVHFSCYPGSIFAEAGQKTLQVSVKEGKKQLSDKATVLSFSHL